MKQYMPRDTQYQRMTQNIVASKDKTDFSPESPKNKSLQKRQVFGSSGQKDKYSPSRNTTLGYFSVK